MFPFIWSLLICLLKLINLLSKSVFFTKSTSFYIAAKFSAVNLLNSGVVIYLSRLGILFSTSLIFAFKAVVINKSFLSGIFCQHLQSFSSNFVYLYFIDLCELATSEIFF